MPRRYPTAPMKPQRLMSALAAVPELAFIITATRDRCRDRVQGGRAKDPLTDRMRRALLSHYKIAQETPFGLYWRARCR